MSTVDADLRLFAVGTTGWKAADLDDPAIEPLWLNGRYEIVEGVLIQIAPAFFTGGEALFNLMRQVDSFARSIALKPRFASEVDIVVNPRRVARADAAMLMPAESLQQKVAARNAGKTDIRRTRIFVPPSLIIESVSPGHEDHDFETKRQWYAEFGVPHYWILDGFSQRLLCLRLENGRFLEETSGHGADILKSSLFTGLSISLPDVWGSD